MALRSALAQAELQSGLAWELASGEPVSELLPGLGSGGPVWGAPAFGVLVSREPL